MTWKSSAIAAVLAIGLSGAAYAQSSSSSGATAQGQKMSDAQCQTLWQRVNPSSTPSVSRAATMGYIQDFSSADKDSNGQLSSGEFMAACRDGKVSGTASTGAGGGTMNDSKAGQQKKQ
ncbi:MAG: hypothetical protein R3D27_09060 [Hyphomicrobiaceae bacterium]